jgi:hypothetical protein
VKVKASLRRRRLRITLSEAATVTVTCKRRGARRNSASLKRKLPAGTTRVTFPRKRLRHGRYVLTVRAVDAAGNRSAPVRSNVRA